jgi:hypothetical protein
LKLDAVQEDAPEKADEANPASEEAKEEAKEEVKAPEAEPVPAEPAGPQITHAATSIT